MHPPPGETACLDGPGAQIRRVPDAGRWVLRIACRHNSL